MESYLGFDLSTQKLKAIQLNSQLEVLVHAEVKFDSDLPEFRTTGGVNAGHGKNEFFVQPVMWVKALDMVMDRLVVQGADLGTVSAISGSAQQHGSLFWSKHGINTLKALDADKFLHTQIDDSAFTVTRTPVWMDGTTEKQCFEMEAAIGGREKMVELTGSKCYERFTGPQIRKIFQQRPDCFKNTERISLVSSFLASIFLGEVAPIDHSDGSGMNLLDINAKCWSDPCLNSCAPDLPVKLGDPVSPFTIIGSISSFFIQRYGFKTDCKVIAFTGDNPSALAGMLIGEDWLAISLGTSDTIMMGLKEPPQIQQGHVFVHPTAEDGFMGMLCFRNGSLVRDVFKQVEGNNSWEVFSELLDSTPRGNFGNLALHFTSKEIIPNVIGNLRWNKSNTSVNDMSAKGVAKFASPQIEVRALIEGQMLHRKAIATDMGFHFGANTRILATGGASANKSILQVMADVFNAPVYTQKTTEAALLGAAYRAKYALYLAKHEAAHNNGHAAVEIGDNGGGVAEDEKDTFYSYINKFLPHNTQRVCDPSKDSENIYNQMLMRFREMVAVMEKEQH